jgi:adenylate kinase family enzyme
MANEPQRPPFEVDATRLSRVNVVGTSGSGKSTFSRRLASLLGHPHIEMDRLFWEPNWQQPTDEVFFSRVQKALEIESWVLDGNYSRTEPIKWKSAQTVIWIDLPFATTLWQAVKRALVRSVTREELWPGTGNRESFRKSFFSKDSIILWTISMHSKVRERYAARMQDDSLKHIQFIRLRSRREVESFFAELKFAQHS